MSSVCVVAISEDAAPSLDVGAIVAMDPDPRDCEDDECEVVEPPEGEQLRCVLCPTPIDLSIGERHCTWRLSSPEIIRQFLENKAACVP